MITLIAFIAVIFLIGSSTITAVSIALQSKGRLQAEEMLKEPHSPFFYRYFLNFFFGKQKWEGLLFSLSFTKHLLRIAYVLSAFFFLIEQDYFHTALIQGTQGNYSFNNWMILAIAVLIIASSLIFDFLFSLLGQLRPDAALKFLSFPSSVFLLFCMPFTAPFFGIFKFFLPVKREKKFSPTFKIRDKVHELLQETELGAYLDPTEQKFILSIVSFKERIAREVMVPRINLFSIAEETTVREAAISFLSEGYSRIPVYRDTVDNIVGVLLYKDVLKIYIEQPNLLDNPIVKLVKPVLYAPETKKISHLLQEFRNKHLHLAIIVDEWGGTEGIVTIEDILEELVGEIADEYDVGQQTLYTVLPGGGWIVDAKMSIIDIQEELDVKIPQSPEYDTIGGYVFHRAGAIPSKGWRIHHDDFDLEVVSSSERAVEKIKITPHA